MLLSFQMIGTQPPGCSRTPSFHTRAEVTAGVPELPAGWRLRDSCLEMHLQEPAAPFLTCKATVKWQVLVSRTMLVFMADWMPHRHCR